MPRFSGRSSLASTAGRRVNGSGTNVVVPGCRSLPQFKVDREASATVQLGNEYRTGPVLQRLESFRSCRHPIHAGHGNFVQGAHVETRVRTLEARFRGLSVAGRRRGARACAAVCEWLGRREPLVSSDKLSRCYLVGERNCKSRSENTRPTLCEKHGRTISSFELGVAAGIHSYSDPGERSQPAKCHGHQTSGVVAA